MGFRACGLPYPVVLAPILFSLASHPDLWLKSPRYPPNPLSRFPSCFDEFNLIFFLTSRFIVLDIYQPPTLPSAEKIDDQEDGNICFFALKVVWTSRSRISSSIHIRNTSTFNDHYEVLKWSYLWLRIFSKMVQLLDYIKACRKYEVSG